MVSLEELGKVCDRSGIELGVEGGPIGRQLRYVAAPERTIVVHFAESDWPATVKRVLEVIAALEAEWILFHRHGALQAHRFSTGAERELAEIMVGHFTVVESELDDLYLLAESGSMFVAFDHHLREEGLAMEFGSIDLASRVLCALNEIGSEIEVFAKNG